MKRRCSFTHYVCFTYIFTKVNEWQLFHTQHSVFSRDNLTIQNTTNDSQWLKWKIRGGGTVRSSLAPCLWLWAPSLQKWAPAKLSKQAFSFRFLILSRKMHESAFWLSTNVLQSWLT